ncbi:MAG: S8 family serine peptidase, partial [Pseudomonadota bacterium]
NNSWGPTGSPQGYDIPTMQIDMITRDADPDTAGQQAVLPVWSIMNGNGDRNFGTCQPSSLGSPDEAKNLFAVGSTVLQTGGGSQINDIFSVSGNSAHGQACDGRLVPHIVAPGCSTDSTTGTSNSSYSANFCGTSMASPVVSGSVSLFFQQYRNDFGIDPSPALVKARFTPVAMDLVGNDDADDNTLGHRPDRKQGWGRLDLDAVINPTVPVAFIDQTVVFENTGENWQRVWIPANPAEPVRLMLAWTDAPGPGTGGTTPAWVNNLDLSVTIGDDVYYGNNISLADGFSEANGTPDGINNLEGVMLSPEQHQGNVLNIEVLAANLAGDGLNPWTPDPDATRQDFAMVCYNCLLSIDLFMDGFEADPTPE